jgi:glycosyltransferase involved in cell wall biosynthesis
MKISVVTVCFNSASTIGRTLDSMLAQTYQDWEHVVIDGASRDGTQGIVSDYGRKAGGRLKFVSEPDKGIYDAMNKGIALCTGDLIAIINSDDWYEPDALEGISKAAVANPEYDVYYGLVRFVDSNGIEESVQRWHHSGLERHTLCHQGCFVALEAFKRFGSFDTSYKLCADYDFLLRVKAGDGRFLPVDTIIANYGTGGASSVNERLRETENLRIRLRHGLCGKAHALPLWLKTNIKAVFYRFSIR